MAIGEASTSTFLGAFNYSKASGRNITTEAIIEERIGDFYGGWRGGFVRKYLADNHPESHKDNPINSYEDSIAGLFFPPGKVNIALWIFK